MSHRSDAFFHCLCNRIKLSVWFSIYLHRGSVIELLFPFPININNFKSPWLDKACRLIISTCLKELKIKYFGTSCSGFFNQHMKYYSSNNTLNLPATWCEQQLRFRSVFAFVEQSFHIKVAQETWLDFSLSLWQMYLLIIPELISSNRPGTVSRCSWKPVWLSSSSMERLFAHHFQRLTLVWLGIITSCRTLLSCGLSITTCRCHCCR